MCVVGAAGLHRRPAAVIPHPRLVRSPTSPAQDQYLMQLSEVLKADGPAEKLRQLAGIDHHGRGAGRYKHAPRGRRRERGGDEEGCDFHVVFPYALVMRGMGFFKHGGADAFRQG